LRILRRWDAGHSSRAIAEEYNLQREGVARVIAANRPYDTRIRKLLRIVFGERAETHDFINTVCDKRNVGRCGICRSSTDPLVRDYCRQRGTIRDLVCRRCRHGLGCFGDDPAKLLKAVAYLLKHPAHSANPVIAGQLQPLNTDEVLSPPIAN
jgi:hypothetical protein